MLEVGIGESGVIVHKYHWLIVPVICKFNILDSQ